MERNGPYSGPVAPDPQRNLLGHRAAGHEHRGRLAEQLGDPFLKVLDEGSLAVGVFLHVGPDHRRQVGEHRVRTSFVRWPAGQSPGTARPDRLKIALGFTIGFGFGHGAPFTGDLPSLAQPSSLPCPLYTTSCCQRCRGWVCRRQ